MSPTALATTTRGRRTPGRPGRFDPSEPLHMTTRHGAAKRDSGGTASTTGSNDDFCSRRGSSDDRRATPSQIQSSPQARRISNTASNHSVDVYASSNSQPPSGNKLAHARSKPEPAMLQSASPSRKRKRTTPTPPNTPPRKASDTLLATKDRTPTPADPLFDMSMDRSVDEESQGTPSDDELEGDYMDVEQSTELTPAATPLGSRAMSSISETSAADIGFSEKLVDAAVTKVVHVPMLEEMEDIEAEDMAEADDIDDGEGDEVDEDHAQVEIRRRIIGRRRAEHQDVKVEAAMRRQLQLKSAFRSITRSLKPLLAELALKTTEALDADPRLHEQVLEYQGNEEHDGIQKQLDDALACRKAQIEAQIKWNKQNLCKAFEGETFVRRSRCELQIEDLREVQLDHLEHDFLVVARQAQKSMTEPQYETEDEDGDVIPVPKGMRYRFTHTGTLDPKYDSRSRQAIECERAVEDLHTRLEMTQAIHSHRVSTGTAPDHAGFAVMDNAARHAANVRKDSIRNLNVLASAATEAERIASIPVIPNEKADKLQVLAKLATRPAIQPFPQSVRLDRPPPPPLGEAFQPQQRIPPQPSMRPLSQLESPQHQPSPRDAMRPHNGDGSLPRPSRSPRHKATPSRGDLAFLLSPPSGTLQNLESSPVVTNSAAPPAPRTSDAVPPPLASVPHQDILDALKRSTNVPQRNELTQPDRSDDDDKSRGNDVRPSGMDSLSRDSLASDREMDEVFLPEPIDLEQLSPKAIETNPLTHNDQSERLKDSLPSHPSLTPRPLPLSLEPPSSPGAPDSRHTEESPPVDMPRETNLDPLLRDSRSRASSVVSQSTSTEATNDAHSISMSDARKSKHKASKSVAAHKMSKTERHGLSRRAFKHYGERRKSKPDSSEGKPQVMRFRLNANETTRPASAQQKHAAVVAPQRNQEHYQQQPYGALPGLPAASSLPPQAPGPGPPYPYPYPGNYDPFHGWQHHNSFPGPPPPGYPWSHPFFPPPLGVPPPPTGVPGAPDYWQQYYGGGGYHHAPQPATYQPTPPSTAGTQGQFGGPAIAPAGDPRSVHGAGASPTHLPAFAQQRRQNDGNSTRKRAQSDHRDFKHYDPDRKQKRREM